MARSSRFRISGRSSSSARNSPEFPAVGVREQRAHLRHHVEGGLQRAQVAGVRPAPGHPRDEALDVVDVPEVFVEFLAGHRVGDKFTDGVVARLDGLAVGERAAEPVGQRAPPERTGGLVEYVHERGALGAVDAALFEHLEAAQRHGIHLEVLPGS